MMIKKKAYLEIKPLSQMSLNELKNAKISAAWEEAEKSNRAARFKREEIKIQAWESRQKAKLDAEMRRIESQIEQMKAEAQAKMLKKVALPRQKSEEMRNCVETRRNSQAEKTTAQAEYVRQNPIISFCLLWLVVVQPGEIQIGYVTK